MAAVCPLKIDNSSVIATNAGMYCGEIFVFLHLPSNGISRDGFYAKWICFASLFLAGYIERKRRGLGTPTAATSLSLQSQSLASSPLDASGG